MIAEAQEIVKSALGGAGWLGSPMDDLLAPLLGLAAALADHGRRRCC